MKEKVLLYTIDCPKCLILEKKLKMTGIEYESIREEKKLKEKNIMVCPVLEVDGELLDFNEAIKWIGENSNGN